MYQDIAEHYRVRLAAAGDEDDETNIKPEAYKRYREVMQKLRQVERSAAVKFRNRNVITDAVLRKLELELHLLEFDIKNSRDRRSSLSQRSHATESC